MNNEEFGMIMETMKKSKATIPLEYVLSILGGIVVDADKDSEHVKEVMKNLEGRELNEVVSSCVLYTCNSIVLNIWKIFGEKLTELAEGKNSEKN